jgi:hypothetical protein
MNNNRRKNYKYNDQNKLPSVLAITDAFFDDIAAFIYAIGINQDCSLVPNAIGYTINETATRVCNGLVKWADCKNVNFLQSYVSENFYDNNDARNNPFRSIIDLNFASNLAYYLKFDNIERNNLPIEPLFRGTKDIWALGPYSDLARQLELLKAQNLDYGFNIWCSGSALINVDSYIFPDLIYVGRGSNAGIDPTATLKVWQLSCETNNIPLFIERQPPITDVYNAIRNTRSWAACQLRKTLNYSMQNNPGGAFVWDLGCALTQQHPDIIIQRQLYNAEYSDIPTSAIKLTKTTIINNSVAQVYVINVSINAMLAYLVADLSR